MADMETILATSVVVFVAFVVPIVVVYLLIRVTKGFESPYDKILKGILILGLALVLLSSTLSLILQQGGWEIGAIMVLGQIIVGIGIVILSWEKFKEGYEESKANKNKGDG